MIKIINLSQEAPYLFFREKYHQALDANQKSIEAISISSFNKETNEVDSRYVNLKFIHQDKFIFFTNYNSPKAIAFQSHSQIMALFYWHSTNIQIRMKANIKKTSLKYNQEYFQNRSAEKNALAISSRQSELTDSYEEVLSQYNEVYKEKNLFKCPKHWGGFSFTPYYFEFWEGHESRINKRLVYEKIDQLWKKSIIQP